MGSEEGEYSRILRRRMNVWKNITLHRPLSEHVVNILGDVFGDLAHLAQACSSLAGRELVSEWIGDVEADGVVRFFSPSTITTPPPPPPPAS